MSAPKKKDHITRNLVIGMVVLVVVVGVAFAFGTNKAQTNAATPSSVEKSEGYGIVFNKGLTGVPKVDIWEDFQCPVCRNFEAVNLTQVNDWINNKKIVAIYHPLSFIGAESAYMANAAACAADEGKFLQMHEALYANQAASENSGKWNPLSLVSLGANLKLTSKTFASCVMDSKYKDWVTNIANDGAKKNINATPTIFVNGKEIARNNDNYFTVNGFKSQVFGK